MTEQDFISLVGPRVWHVTAAENLPGIDALGMLRPSTLAKRARCGGLALREERLKLDLGAHTARLNNQMALRAGANSAAKFLDSHTMESWSAQLDSRIFLWPDGEGAAFDKSHGDIPVARFAIDSVKLFNLLPSSIDLAPINTGSAKRRPAPRGDWIYVAATKSSEDFRMNRVRRGLTKSPDAVKEISIRVDITPDLMRQLRLPA
jgi:hypothetical protein